MRKFLLPLIAFLSIAAIPQGDGLTHARLGQRLVVGEVRVTPLRVLEDSRCPMEARCVWAGQVRLLVRIATRRGHADCQITSNRPLAVGRGTLELVSVMPPRSTQHPPRLRDYRFAFSFTRRP